MNPTVFKSAGVLIQDKKLLLARDRGEDIFVSPGGRIEPDETSRQTLVRELSEEFGIVVNESELELFGTFTHPQATDPSKILQMDVYIVKSWDGIPTPQNEIEEMKWVETNDLKDIQTGSIFAQEVIPKLKADNLIN